MAAVAAVLRGADQVSVQELKSLTEGNVILGVLNSNYYILTEQRSCSVRSYPVRYGDIHALERCPRPLGQTALHFQKAQSVSHALRKTY
jgi:hypothetical protein